MDGNNVRVGEVTTSSLLPCGLDGLVKPDVKMAVLSARISSWNNLPARQKSKLSPKPEHNSRIEGSIGELAPSVVSREGEPEALVEPWAIVCSPPSPKSTRLPVGTICAGEFDCDSGALELFRFTSQASSLAGEDSGLQ